LLSNFWGELYKHEPDIKGKRFVFSGNTGRPDGPMLVRREKTDRADVLFTESTLGDRLHPVEKTSDVIKRIIDNAVSNHGSLIVSSFAVDRAQDFMYKIWKLKKYLLFMVSHSHRMH